jgi:hypothetical protein
VIKPDDLDIPWWVGLEARLQADGVTATYETTPPTAFPTSETCAHPGLAIVPFYESEWHESFQCALCQHVKSYVKKSESAAP